MLALERTMKTATCSTLIGIVTGFALVAGSAHAAGTIRVSTMSNEGKRVLANIDFTGPGNLRASAVFHGRPVLVLRDGEAFALAGGNEQRLNSAAMAAAANIVRPNTGDEVIGKLISLKNTGRKETRAGFECDVYEMSFYDRDGRRRLEQIAVSSDPRARELTDLWKSLNDALLPGAIDEAGDLQKHLRANGLGLLRFSYRYQVDRIEEAVRLPPVQAFRAPPTTPAYAPDPAALAGQQAAAVPAVQELTPYQRVRKFTQGSLLDFLFGA
jgi:hypothetical protein